MVLVHVRQSASVQFLYDTTSGVRVSDLSQVLLSMYLDVSALLRLCDAFDRLAPESPQTTEMLRRTSSDARALVSPSSKTPLSPAQISQSLHTLHTALSLSGASGVAAEEGASTERPARCAVWWAGKELLGERCLWEYCGKNEKTKIVVRLAIGEDCHGPPPMPEDPEEVERGRKALAEMHRRQEEINRAREDGDDDLGDSSDWSNPSSLKQKMSGLGPVSWRPN